MKRLALVIFALTACGSPPEVADSGWVKKTYAVETLDINTTVPDREYASFFRLEPAGSRVFGVAFRARGGALPFVSDGTPEGTRVLTMRRPAFIATDIPDLVVGPDGIAYFIGWDLAFGYELFRTDGTEEGTWRLTDCGVGGADGFNAFTEDSLAFAVVPGAVVLRCDGVVQRLDLASGALTSLNPALAEPKDFRAAGPLVYFSALLPNAVRAPFVTDGSPAGTRQLASVSVDVPEFTPVGPRVFFSGGLYRDQIHVVDTDGVARLVRDLGVWNATGHGAHSWIASGDKAFFFDGAFALWVTDGTDAGTLRFDDAGRGSYLYNPYRTQRGSPYSGVVRPIVIGDDVWFVSRDGLWVSDGGAAAEVTTSCAPLEGHLGVAGSRPLFHTAADTLCSVDGLLATDAYSDGPFAPLGNDALVGGDKLLRTDGTMAGTRVLVGGAVARASTYPYWITPRGDGVIFSGDGLRSWSDAGSALLSPLHPNRIIPTSFGLFIEADESGLVKIEPGPSTVVLSNPQPRYAGYVTLGSRLVFMMCNFGPATESVWVTDGTAAGTQRLVSNPVDGCRGSLIASDGSNAFFVLNSPGTASLRWTDGARIESVPVAAGAYVSELKGGDGVVWLASTTGLWRVRRANDGTYETVPITRAPSGRAGTWWKGELYFSVGEPFRTAGDAGVLQLADIFPGPGSSASGGFIPAGDDLFFSAVDPDAGRELWKTRGTPDTTTRVADLWPGPSSGYFSGGLWLEPEHLLVFAGSDPDGGTELWRTDGTATGTRRVVDLVPGPGSSDPLELARAGDWLYFSASDPDAGNELRRIPVAALLDEAPPPPPPPDTPRGCSCSTASSTLCLLTLVLLRRRARRGSACSPSSPPC